MGNGFDLSHYLPTKYEHFMSVMKNIESWSNNESEMYFDDLFEKDNWFFKETKSIYQVEKVCISSVDIENLKDKLKKNVWYKFFSNHLNNIDTWIDFESELSNALDLVAIFSEKAEDIYKIYEKVENIVICRVPKEETKHLLFRHKTIEKLSLLGILEPLSTDAMTNGAKIKQKYYRNKDINLDIDFNLIISELEFYLNDFIYLFKWYLQEIIQKLEPINSFDPSVFEFELDNSLVMSFNYTSTLNRFYASTAKVEYIHGEVNKELVLGIPDLKNEFLKKFKNYSFTKYHQKLLKDTDYLFLEENQKIKIMFEDNAVGKRNINIYIWGHSLADSDESYIHEIFSLNRKSNIECYVTVYFYENDAPRLLNNLLDILDKDKVEQWMKKGWLKFEKNPEINFQTEDRAVLEEVSQNY